MVTIRESGMVFGEFPEDCVFKIENSNTHKIVGDGVKTVEFVYLQAKNKLLFVEAKSSSPRYDTSIERYYEFIDEITDKFVHSFEMYMALKLRRYEELSEKLATVDDSDMKYRFILVINGHKNDWLLPIQEELKIKLRYHHNIWKSEVVAINEQTAKSWNLTTT